jgi:cytochrome P450
LDFDRTFTRQFGGGRYACLGAVLARLELGLVLKVMLARFPNLNVSEFEWAGTLLTHGPKKLHVTW